MAGEATNINPHRPLTSGRALVAFIIFVLTLPAPKVAAQEDIATFKLTDINSDFSIRYLLDERSDEGLGGGPFTSSELWKEELLIRTRSYVYHPALLEMEISGGPTLVQYGYESDQGDNSGRETLFNYDAWLNFLERKAYPFSVFVRRDHPEITTGLLGRFLARTDEYGMRGVVRPTLVPMMFFWDASHLESEGSGFGATVDDVVDRASLRTSLPYKDVNNLRLDVNWNERESRSGSPGLPIQESMIETLTTQLSGGNVFGDERAVRLNQHLYLLQQETRTANTTEVDNLTYNGNLRWQNSDRVNTYGNYRYNDQERTGSWSRSQDISAGASFKAQSGFTVNGNGNFSSNESPGFSRDRTGAVVLANYNLPLAFGSFGLSGTVGLDRTDQESTSDTSAVFDESIVLVGIVPVALNEDFIVAGTVIVTNIALTQTFIEDIDYRLVTIGSTTTIERIVTGNIVDGEEVLVSYDYLTGGTVEYDTRRYGISANLNLFTHANLFVRFDDTENDIISGIATTPLNDRTLVEIGGRVDYPLAGGWLLGGDYRYTEQDENISPFDRTSYDVYVQTASYGNTSVRFGVHRETTDYERSREDVDLARYLLTITSRLPGGIHLTYRGVHGEDDGGSIFREDLRHSLQLDWRYRSVLFSLRADQSDIEQGATRRENTRVTGEFRRRF